MAHIKRIGVVKFALFSALWAVIMGLIEGLLFYLASLLIPSTITVAPGVNFELPSTIALLLSPLAIIILPISLGILVFILSLLIGLIINLILKIIGGLQLSLDFTEEKTAIAQRA